MKFTLLLVFSLFACGQTPVVINPPPPPAGVQSKLIGEVIQLTTLTPDASHNAQITLTKTPIVGTSIIFYLESSQFGMSFGKAATAQGPNTKIVNVQVPDYTLTPNDKLYIVYSTNE
jgi:hypothetical protein